MRIAGTNIPDNKRMEIALSYLFGIGVSSARKILEEINISKNRKIKDLTPQEVARLREAVERRPIEGELHRRIMMNIKRLRDIKSYRGIRHIKGLPVRGQRTKTNARTRKGKRKTVTSGKRKTEKT